MDSKNNFSYWFRFQEYWHRPCLQRAWLKYPFIRRDTSVWPYSVLSTKVEPRSQLRRMASNQEDEEERLQRLETVCFHWLASRIDPKTDCFLQRRDTLPYLTTPRNLNGSENDKIEIILFSRKSLQALENEINALFQKRSGRHFVLCESILTGWHLWKVRPMRIDNREVLMCWTMMPLPLAEKRPSDPYRNSFIRLCCTSEGNEALQQQ